MQRIVINNCFGGFSISKECAGFMAERGSEKAQRELKEYAEKMADPDTPSYSKVWFGYGSPGGYDRTDKNLIAAIETLGHKASGSCAALSVVDVPDGAEWEIAEYDGTEWVAEKHRTWGD